MLDHDRRYTRERARAVDIDGVRSRLTRQIDGISVSKGGGVVGRADDVGHLLPVRVIERIGLSAAERIFRLPGEGHGIDIRVRSRRSIGRISLRLCRGVEHSLLLALGAFRRRELRIDLNEVLLRSLSERERINARLLVKHGSRQTRLIVGTRVRDQRPRIRACVNLIIYAARRAVLVPSEHGAAAVVISLEVQSAGEVDESAEQAAQAEVFFKTREQVVEQAHQTHVHDLIFAQAEIVEVDIKYIFMREHDFDDRLFGRRRILVVDGDGEFYRLHPVFLIKFRPDRQRHLFGNDTEVER